MPVLARLARVNFIIPYYHMVSDDAVPHLTYLYDYKNAKQFEADIDFLLKNYLPINIFDTLHSLKNESPPTEKSFLLTFDDGFREMFEIVAPILLKKGVPATFFISSGFIDNENLCYQHKASLLAHHFPANDLFSDSLKRVKEILLDNKVSSGDIKSSVLSIKYRNKEIIDEIAKEVHIDFNDYLKKKKPYLTSQQIEEMITKGFAFGAHSIDHPLYASLSLKEQIYQTTESVRFVKERFNLHYGAFAFPHNDFNVSSDFFESIYNNGLLDISFGTGGMATDSCSNNFQRISFEKPLMPAEKILPVQYAKRIYQIARKKDRIIRKNYHAEKKI